MNTDVTNWELIIILLASILTVFFVLFIVGKWLNFHLYTSCINRLRNRKFSTNISVREESAQEPRASFIDLSIINEPPKTTHDSSLWTPAVGSISSLITNDTTFDDTLMPNSTSAYEIISYANNIKSTLKRTISCDFDEDVSIQTSMNDLHLTDENISLGKLQITINYNVLEEYLEIFVLQIRDLVLPKKNQENSRIFLIAWLNDDQNQIQQTDFKSYQHHQTILLNSSMQWKVNDDHLPSTVLNTSLYTRDESQTDTLIAECSFALGEIYIYQPLTTWLNLHDTDETNWYRGEISISLCYHPTADRLTCAIIQARNLIFHQQKSFNTDMISTDCYATISLLHRHEIRKKTRTNSHHATDRNPVFNEISVFNVSSHDLLTSDIRIVVYEILTTSSTITKTFEIGHCLIGNHDRTQPTSHWQQMLRVLRRPVIVWHPLKL